eukprot:CAMPEP_0181088058 /NCGR_PEP_ID=MMETSP1071-20121207/6589_1 /TAXON_ID=35127 /ORGANISM="Thalassiosira sp., Strain NH16" /LENGTH=541 /DNA_ID=CAMNT_0023169959 /DNA_START=421 /DNA_END=2046 /DNA_ORIENTATION=-
MTDRSIIAGASQEFSAFVSTAYDSPEFVKENPDAGIGILQAAFICGYTIALLLSGHFVHTMRWKPLVLGGLCVWWLGVLGSGNAKQYNSFYVLLFSRMATGCSEAAFQVVAPPLIQDRGGNMAGFWLSIYLTGLPLGLAFGYVYGSHMAGSDEWGWDWAYYFMCIASIPILAVMMFVRDETNGGILGRAGESVNVDNIDYGEDDGEGPIAQQPLLARSNEDEAQTLQGPEGENFTLVSEIKACLSSPVLVTLSLGWSAIIGVVASLGTFGGAFVLALQLYDDERDAAYSFGVAAALAGVIGTPLGGSLVDKIMERYTGSNTHEPMRGGEGIDDSLRYPIIASVVARINALVVTAMLFVVPTLVMKDATFFLSFLFIGWTLLFMTQTGVTLVALLSVDRSHRPNAMAFLMITSHLLGDVPLPIVLGLIKDQFAPSCRVRESGEFEDPEGCKAQQAGVRQTLAIAYAWILWSIIFLEITRRIARHKIWKTRTEEHNTLLLQEENGSEDNRAFQYYHSRFQPPQYDEKANDDVSPSFGTSALKG